MATRPAAPWGPRPISTARSSVSTAARPRSFVRTLGPAPAPPPEMDEGERKVGDRPGTAREAGNFIRSLEAPKLGVDRYIESRMALSAGTRELRGDRRGGAKYTAGPYKGLTKGQALERARAEYGSMKDADRARWERSAQAGDVMSDRERAAEDRHYAARGMAAQQAGGGPYKEGAGEAVPSVLRNQSAEEREAAKIRFEENRRMLLEREKAAASPQDAPTFNTAPTSVADAPPLNGSPAAPPAQPATPRSRGTINGIPTEQALDRTPTKWAGGNGAGGGERLDTGAPMERMEQPWVRDFRERTGREPMNAGQRAKFRADADEYRRGMAEKRAAETLSQPLSTTGYGGDLSAGAPKPGISKPGPSILDEEEAKKRRAA